MISTCHEQHHRTECRNCTTHCLANLLASTYPPQWWLQTYQWWRAWMACPAIPPLVEIWGQGRKAMQPSLADKSSSSGHACILSAIMRVWCRENMYLLKMRKLLRTWRSSLLSMVGSIQSHNFWLTSSCLVWRGWQERACLYVGRSVS